jgi:hypothetical protein
VARVRGAAARLLAYDWGVDRVWYVAYGSNMRAARLRYYLGGGRMPGTDRVYPGCRDGSEPVRDAAITLSGGIYFALRSRVWAGGMAFYDPALAGGAAARAYLLTAAQFSDIASQEMHRVPVADLALADAVRTGRHRFGPGRYETLLCLGMKDGAPLLTFTAPWTAAEVAHTTPTAAYLRMLAHGLAESHRWPPDRIGEYLASRPGAAGAWSPSAVAALLAA